MYNRFVLNETSYHGAGAVKAVAEEITARGFKKAFVASDPDLIKFGVTKKVTDLLDAANFAYAVYSEIKPNPTIQNVQDGVAAFKAAEADCIVTIGGGWLIAWSAFRPMEKILAAADSISAGEDLSARLNITRGPSEMRRLGAAFDRMFGRLEASFDAERQFTSDASHELRTPITVILAECDRAKRKARTRDDFLESLNVIEEQGYHMSQLVQELLGLTRMQHGTDKYPMKRLDLSEFVGSCCEECPPPPGSNAELTTDIQPGIEASFNAGLMSRVIVNLLQNAYKYGGSNAHIRVSLHTDDSGKAVLSVSDDGPGIAPEYQDKVWQRFWQADPSHGEDGGCGLGLAMVKEIVQFHGGSVALDSTPGKGSIFSVTI